MMRYILYALLAWFLYKLIFDFIIPVYKTTRQVKKKFTEMQEQQMKQQSFNQQSAGPKSSPKPPGGDYIDFEEVK